MISMSKDADIPEPIPVRIPGREVMCTRGSEARTSMSTATFVTAFLIALTTPLATLVENPEAI